jgi:dTDP-4-amino-4,6-dideoxygalactose transaminase
MINPTSTPPQGQAGTTPDGLWFGKDLSASVPIPEAGIDRAVELMRSGRLHRYGEQGNGFPEPALLEQDFATYLGSKFCVAVNSCGSAMFIALKALGVKADDPVLTSSFTLAPVPGAIAHAGGRPVLVETNEDYTTDLADLEAKIKSSGSRVFLLSHMRGHIADLPAIRDLCASHGVALVEDCAHTMGAKWDGQPTGTWGKVGCFSTQTYKHINSGEGGLLVTNDEDVAAQAILMSGCYMMYGQHILKPSEATFERWKYLTPNFSMRMSNLAAALLRPQIALLEKRAVTWNHHYAGLKRELEKVPAVSLPMRSSREDYVASSIQFSLSLTPPQIERFIRECDLRGLYIKWFGRTEPLAFTSHFGHWRYIDTLPDMPRSMRVMDRLLDMRMPLSLTEEDYETIGKIVAVAVGIASI